MAEAVEDAVITAELEEIHDDLSSIREQLEILDDITDNQDSTNSELVAIRYDIEDSVDVFGSYNETIIAYLFFLIVTIFIILGFVFAYKLAKWIEFLFSDR